MPQKKATSIKRKLTFLPLVVIFIVMATIAILNTYFMRLSLLTDMKNNGIHLSETLVTRLNDNAKSLEVVDTMLEETIVMAARTIIRNQENLDNQLIYDLANELEIDEVNWFSPEGEVLYSNLDEYVGWKTSRNI